MKIGDTAIYEAHGDGNDMILIGTVMSIDETKGSVYIDFEFMPGQPFEVSIDRVVKPENYEGKHHALLIGVKP